MSIEIAIEAQKLADDLSGLVNEVLAAVGGNVSANKRARKKSVELRAGIKELRKRLLDLEKGR
tara:strand:- start:5223 stop:5411 length:189 start_codon:yes stop_codon:yes gene_type:complete